MTQTYWHRKSIVKTFVFDRPSPALSRFLNKLLVKKSRKILDIGCGGGRNTEMIFRKGFDVYACDNSTPMVKASIRRMRKYFSGNLIRSHIIKATMEKLPYKNDFFDVIVSNGVFHNATSENMFKKTVIETHRVLKNTGLLYLNMFYMYEGTTNIRETKYPNLFLTKNGLKMTLLSCERIISTLKDAGLELHSNVKLSKKKLDVGNRGILRAVFIKKTNNKKTWN